MFIVCLCGGSGSGKTTLSRQIIQMFPKDLVTILPLDSYYKDRSYLTQKEKEVCNFDHPDSIDYDLLIEHLHQLKMAIPVQRPVYSYITCSRENQCIVMQPSEVLIIEGLLTLASEKLRNEADLKIYIDVSEHIRLERTIKRDIEERGRTRESVIERFYKTVQPMYESFVEPYKQIADVVIDGNNLNINSLATTIVQIIGEHLYHYPISK
ncbi:MAG TPA: uridine kinase [Bacteroidales bacterium]